MPSQADEIRRHALECYVQPWRESGESTLSIQARTVAQAMELPERTSNICNALRGRKFLREAGLTLIHRTGPLQGSTTTFHYRDSNA